MTTPDIEIREFECDDECPDPPFEVGYHYELNGRDDGAFVLLAQCKTRAEAERAQSYWTGFYTGRMDALRGLLVTDLRDALQDYVLTANILCWTAIPSVSHSPANLLDFAKRVLDDLATVRGPDPDPPDA